VSGLLEEIQPEDINAELISDLIYIEQVERGGRKVKFKDLDLYMELWLLVQCVHYLDNY
jgi:hypothetical protein